MPRTPARADAQSTPATVTPLADSNGNGTVNAPESTVNPANQGASEMNNAPQTPATVKAPAITIANAQHAANILGIKIPAVRALVHKGKLQTQTIDMPEFGIFGQVVVTADSINAYKLAQSTPGAKRGGGKTRTHVSYKMQIPRADVDRIVALLAEHGITAAPASQPRKKTGTATDSVAPVAGAPVAPESAPVA
jgi:hypothetical protein